MSYNVIPEDIAKRIYGFKVDATTTPSYEVVEEFIQEATAIVNARLVSNGVDVAFCQDPANDAYYICRGIILRMVCSMAETAKNRDETNFSRTQLEESFLLLDGITSRPSNLGNAKSNSPDAVTNFKSSGRQHRDSDNPTLSMFQKTGKI